MLNGVDYKTALAVHKNGVDKPVVKNTLEILRAQHVSYFRDGGDALGVSRYAREIAPDFGINYATPIFAIHKEGSYGSIVGPAYHSMTDFIKLIAQAVQEGCDFVKLMFSGILCFDTYGRLSCPSLSASEISQLVHIAHSEGLRVMAHVNGSDAITAALEAGTDSIEHGYFMDAECVTLLAQSGAIWVPTLSAVAAFCGRPGFDSKVIGRIVSEQQQTIRTALAAGALVASGSDSGAVGVLHGQGTITENELLARIAGEEWQDAISIANHRVMTLFRR